MPTAKNYRVLEELGRGGMGVVYRAEDTRLGRAVALKFLPPKLVSEKAALDRFQREARAASALNHPNICTIYDVGESDDGRPFLVMELLEGETLQARLRRGALPSAEVLALGLEVAAALEAAHAKGIVHRDLKPANIFITASGAAKVLDFGLAKLMPAHGAAASAEEAPTVAEALGASNLTQVGAAMGTVAYMSPEQARGAAVDARSDLFSLGVVLFEAASGRGAFPGATSAVIFDGILNRTPDLNAIRSPELAAVLGKALEKDEGLRYQSAADLRSDLRRLQRDSESGRQAAHSGALPVRATGRKRRSPIAWSAVALGILAAAALGWWYFGRRAPMIGARDTVVLADFSNSTGDAMFNGALRQGLAAQLEQTPFFHLASEASMADTERLMTLAPSTPIVGSVARQLCQRMNGAATIEGSIAQLGDTYNLILNAVNCSTGDNLASVAVPAAGKDQVLKALGTAADGLRSKLGESLASMHRFNAPIEQATTPSLEALQAYTLGRKALTDGDMPSAISLFQHALSLDANFAMADASLATAESNLVPPDTTASESNITKAYALRDRVSQRERMYITARYDDLVSEDLRQTERDYATWKQTYPNDSLPFGNAAVVEGEIGDADQGLSDARAAVRLDPGNATFAGNLGDALRSLGHLEEGRAELLQTLQRWPGGISAHALNFLGAHQAHDGATQARELAWLRANPNGLDLALNLSAVQANGAGQTSRIHQLLRQIQADDPPGANSVRAGQELSAALSDAIFGFHDQAISEADAALRLSRDHRVLDSAAQVYALAGDSDRAEQVIAELEHAAPATSIIHVINIPINRALTALARHQPDAALAAIAPVAPYELGTLAQGYPFYIRGTALLQQKQPAAAAVEFAKILPTPSEVPIYAATVLGLARAQAQSGDTAAARATYQGLMAQWKSADPGVPLIEAARAEFKALPAGR